MTKKKLNSQQALKLLQSKFKKETAQIFGQLDQFREGSKSMEVYTQQTAAQHRSERLSVQPNMFNQILHYLSFRDEIIQGYEEGNAQSLFIRQIPQHDIQKVIFDKNYLKFIKQRQKAQMKEQQAKNEFEHTTGYSQIEPDRSVSPKLNQEKGIQTAPNKFQMNKVQFVQYECIKSELREEYDKRINYLNKRIQRQNTKQGPYQDAHLILMQNNTADMNDLAKPGPRNRGSGFNSSPRNKFTLPGMNRG